MTTPKNAGGVPVQTRTRGGDPAIKVQVPAPETGFGQVLLHCDEDGALRWVYSDDAEPAERGMRGGETRTYTIPRRVITDPSPGTRGLVGAIGKKVLKVLTFKLIDAAAGAAAQFFAKRWEDKAAPHRLRTFEPGTYRDPLKGVATMPPAQLQELAAGPALLFVHGTMALSHSGFGRIPPAVLAQLHDAYHGRVFAFDHPTVSVAPDDNAKWFASQLGDTKLTLDIVSHSRGGLVSRELAERGPHAGLADGALTIRKLLMFGTPNAGTALADSKHIGSLVDRFTNLMTLIPDNAVTDVAAIVISVVKQIAVGAFGGLDGLTVMAPDSAYLKTLNGSGAGATDTYLAVASNYEPPKDAPLARIAPRRGCRLRVRQGHQRSHRARARRVREERQRPVPDRQPARLRRRRQRGPQQLLDRAAR